MKKFNNATQTYILQCQYHNKLCHTVHWIGTVYTATRYHWDNAKLQHNDNLVVLNYDNLTLCQSDTYTKLHSYNVIKWHIFKITYWRSDNMKQ